MATLSLKNFTALVQDMAAGVQSSASAVIDFSVGSVVRAVMEANASVALWLQWLIVEVLNMTRASTSDGSDLDSWVADFNLTRLPAVASSGTVTFSRNSTAGAAVIPVGATVKTLDGARTFQVVADAGNAAWNGSTGFTLPIGQASVDVTVQDITTDDLGALAVGTAGNVVAGAIGLLATAVSNVDSVTNAAPFVNGIDAESDDALRSRFSDYIQTRSRGTVAAVQYAVSYLGQNITATVQENVDTLGATLRGHFVVTVDDGTGAPPSSLLDQATLAIDAYRPVGTTFSVQAPSVLSATVTMTLTTDPVAASTPTLRAAVQAAVLAYINGLPDGSRLPYSRLAMVAYMVDPSIVDVTGVTLNAGTSDLVPTPGQVVKAIAANVTVN